jgi:NaMN:DMB phosphoribosyltransferase
MLLGEVIAAVHPRNAAAEGAARERLDRLTKPPGFRGVLAEPGHGPALGALGLRPLLGLDLRLGEGTGALPALPLVASAARALRDVATFDSAGVTEK